MLVETAYGTEGAPMQGAVTTPIAEAAPWLSHDHAERTTSPLVLDAAQRLFADSASQRGPDVASLAAM
jgi:hypothetical protein